MCCSHLLEISEVLLDLKLNDSDGKNGIILDAKYKQLQNLLTRDDLYQIITYMHTMKIGSGGFLYPLAKAESETQPSKPLQHQHYQLAGYGGKVSAIGLVIPQTATSYDAFCKMMNVMETALCDRFC